MTDETAAKELEGLLPTADEIMDICWGKGLETVDSGTNDRYKAVKNDCGYKNTGEILTKASEVFCSEYVDYIKNSVFTDGEDTDPRYMIIDGVLKADTQYKAFEFKGKIKPESAKILKQSSSMMLVEVEYTDGDKNELTLVLENGKWLLNSPTY